MDKHKVREAYINTILAIHNKRTGVEKFMEGHGRQIAQIKLGVWDEAQALLRYHFEEVIKDAD